MGQVPIAPEHLGDAHEHALTAREHGVERPRSEEGPMNEVVGNGVRVPPQTDGDECGRRQGDNRYAVRDGQRDEEAIGRGRHGVTVQSMRPAP
jgi:hypothetical protein